MKVDISNYCVTIEFELLMMLVMGVHVSVIIRREECHLIFYGDL